MRLDLIHAFVEKNENETASVLVFKKYMFIIATMLAETLLLNCLFTMLILRLKLHGQIMRSSI